MRSREDDDGLSLDRAVAAAVWQIVATEPNNGQRSDALVEFSASFTPSLLKIRGAEN